MSRQCNFWQNRLFIPLWFLWSALLFFSSSLYAEILSLPHAKLDGHFIQGGLVIGKTTPGNRVYFNNQSVRVSHEGIFLIGFHRDEPLQISLKITSPEYTELLDTTLNIKKRQYNIQRIDGLPPPKVTPVKPEMRARIKKEQQLARQACTRDDERRDFMAPFIRPTIGSISGVYGSQQNLKR